MGLACDKPGLCMSRLATRPCFVTFTYIYESCQFGCRVYRVHRLLRSIGPRADWAGVGSHDMWAQGEPTRCGASLSTSTPSLSASERGRAAEHAKASVDDGCRSNKRLRRNMLLIFSSIVSVPELAAAQSFVASTIIVSRARRMRAARCLQSRPPMLPMLRARGGASTGWWWRGGRRCHRAASSGIC